MNAVRLRASVTLALAFSAASVFANEPQVIWQFIGTGLRNETTEYSHSGNLIATSNGLNGYVIKLWNAHTGAYVRSLIGSTHAIPDIAFSPDDQYIVSAGQDRHVRMWRVSDGQLIRSTLEPDAIQTIAWVDSTRFVTGSSDGGVRLYRASDGLLLKTFTGVGLGQMDVMPGGSRFVSNRGIFGIDQQYNRMPLQAVGHPGNLKHVKFSPNGRIIAGVVTDGSTGRLMTWHSTSGALNYSAPIPLKSTELCFTPDGSTIITGDFEDPGKLSLWRASDGAFIKAIGSYDNYVHGISVSPDGTSVIGADYGGMLPIWRLSDGTLIRTLSQFFEHIARLEHHSDGASFFTTWSTTITQRNTATGAVMRSFPSGAQGTPTISRDGTLLGCSFNDPVGGALFRISDGTLVRSFPVEMGANYVATSPDNSLAVLGCGRFLFGETAFDTIARIFRVSDGQLLMSLNHTSPVIFAEFSPDGSRLITGTRIGIRVYNTTTWTFTSIAAPTSDHMTTDLSSTKAVTAKDNVVTVWDLNTGLMIHQFTTHAYPVKHVSFSNNGSMLGSSSFVDHAGPSEIRIWRMSDGLQTHFYNSGIGAGVTGFDVAPDGQSFIFSKVDIGLTRAALP